MQSEKRTGRGTLLIVTGALLLLGAAALMLRNQAEERRAGDASTVVLGALLNEMPPPEERTDAVKSREDLLFRGDSLVLPDYVLDPDTPMPELTVDGHDYITTISIPVLGLELPVMSEWSYDNLRIAPCRYAGSLYRNDMVICAHNYDIHFGFIRNLSPGDSVIVTDVDGNVFHFQVSAIEILAPEMVSSMVSGEWDLTMFTCTLGGANRVTVRCDRVQ